MGIFRIIVFRWVKNDQPLLALPTQQIHSTPLHFPKKHLESPIFPYPILESKTYAASKQSLQKPNLPVLDQRCRDAVFRAMSCCDDFIFSNFFFFWVGGDGGYLLILSWGNGLGNFCWVFGFSFILGRVYWWYCKCGFSVRICAI